MFGCASFAARPTQTSRVNRSFIGRCSATVWPPSGRPPIRPSSWRTSLGSVSASAGRPLVPGRSMRRRCGFAGSRAQYGEAPIGPRHSITKAKRQAKELSVGQARCTAIDAVMPPPIISARPMDATPGLVGGKLFTLFLLERLLKVLRALRVDQSKNIRTRPDLQGNDGQEF
jgi:hypothetical protein